MNRRLDRPQAAVTAPRAAALVLGLMVAVGCNWTTFSDDANQAPIRSIHAPGGYSSQDFGRSLLPLATGQGSAAAFVATGINDTNMAIVTIDEGGGAKTANVPSTELMAINGSAITSLVEVETPGTSPTRLLLGTPVVRDTDHGAIYLDPLPDGPVTEFAVPAIGSTESGWGRGLAAGRLAGVEATPDYVIGSDNQIAVVIDGIATAAAVGNATTVTGAAGCDTTYDALLDPQFFVRRPMLVARLWADPAAATGQQLITGSTHEGVMGTLSFFDVATTGTTYTLNCLAAVTGTVPHFGQSLAVGDFDGDGNLDLLVGAPKQQAFVYLNLATLPLGTLPAAIPISNPAGVDFGYAVAALNVDGVPGDEALIGDPQATVGGQTNAGHVLAYALDKTTLTFGPVPTEFADHSPQSDANFGSSVNALSFCTDPAAAGGVDAGAAATPCPALMTSRVLMVGAGNEVFVYFRVGDNIPMRGGQKIPDVRAP
jgi:hypothetical protein